MSLFIGVSYVPAVAAAPSAGQEQPDLTGQPPLHVLRAAPPLLHAAAPPAAKAGRGARLPRAAGSTIAGGDGRQGGHGRRREEGEEEVQVVGRRVVVFCGGGGGSFEAQQDGTTGKLRSATLMMRPRNRLVSYLAHRWQSLVLLVL